MTDTADLMTADEFARLSGIGVNQVRASIKAKEGLPGMYLGGNADGKHGVFYIRREWVEKWLRGEPGFWRAPEQEPKHLPQFVHRIAS
jgi:hypothetical protein